MTDEFHKYPGGTRPSTTGIVGASEKFGGGAAPELRDFVALANDDAFGQRRLAMPGVLDRPSMSLASFALRCSRGAKP